MENPTVGVVERLAAALGAEITDFFRRPLAGEAGATTLRRGRKPKER